MSELAYIKAFLWDIELLSYEVWNLPEGNYYRCMTDDRIFVMMFPKDDRFNPYIITTN